MFITSSIKYKSSVAPGRTFSEYPAYSKFSMMIPNVFFPFYALAYT
jgi:hypothetical protein